jgi:hypothetical protein
MTVDSQEQNPRSVALVKAAFLSIGALLVALLISFFGFSGGVRINTDAWPASAKQILKETPGSALSSEQWRRIDRALEAHGGNSSGTHFFAAEIRKVLPVFVLVPLFFLLFIPFLKPLRTWEAVLILVAPCAIVAIAASVHRHAYFMQ